MMWLVGASAPVPVAYLLLASFYLRMDMELGGGSL